ncbi:cysteine protease ATG4 [Annulohypoxylon maeteangense]|uniref:cysteine protease ATG4 n=1 Tax=Annulohypoxylon maeteangense TaxID=1927788 RepID=UPI00200886C5|nr:cysteine protease ATG4 [Annulohypoxylon maeteangense]KAI0881008.1 cysteine protease ATG4 [Annulohypoxylon maeteangense]
MDTTVDLGRRIVQMFWDPEPTNDVIRDQPVWCLGSSYKLNSSSSPKSDPSSTSAPAPNPSSAPAPATASASEPSPKDPIQAPSRLPETPPDSTSSSFDSSLAYDEAPLDGGWPPAFLDDFESRIWMTYRSEFDPITKSHDPKALSALSFSMRLKSQLSDQTGFASDSGWGCMIRSGQSLLANAMLVHRLGRGWRRSIPDREEKKIVSLFADDPRAPYSIHNFVRHGASACGKYPGEWFGPSATARCIQALTNSTEATLRVYSTGDGPDVYEDNFMKIAKPDDNTFHPTVILVGTRLGIDKITPVYWEALTASLQMPQSIGIAGGRPSSSHYFIGVQGLHFFYLDPHYTRPALPYHEEPEEYTEEELDTCHTRKLRRLHVKEMDPSMLIGFLIRDEEDWRDWRRSVKHVQGKAIIHVSDHDPTAHMHESGGPIDEVQTLSDEDEEMDRAEE